MKEFWNHIAKQKAKEEFDVPSGYFEHMQQEVESNTLLDELKVDYKSYDVPQTYFDELEDNIFDQLGLNETDTTSEKDSEFQLPEVAPSDANKEFSVPENYFSELDEGIKNKVSGAQKVNKEAKLRWLLPVISVAAALALVFTLNIEAEVVELDDLAYLEYLQQDAGYGELALLSMIENDGYSLDDSELISLQEDYLTEQDLEDYLLYNINELDDNIILD